MAATVRPDDHHILMRRIGYSVALEPVPVRIPDLIEAYSVSNTLDRSAWYALCKEWDIPSGVHERKKKRAEHFLDVVSALGFTLQSEQILSPAPPLEAGAVVRKLVPDRRADLTTILLLIQIIESDADVFLNVLQAGGDAGRLDEMLNDVVERKREVLMPLFMSGTLRDRLDRILDIARESEVRGKRPARSPISKDLLDKAIDTRTRWADRLGVLVGGTLSPMGERLVAAVDKLSEITAQRARILWPYDYQLTALRLSPERLSAQIPVPSVWHLAASVAGAVLDADFRSDAPDQARVIDGLNSIHQAYQVLNPGKNALAAQMPVTVANLAYPILEALRGDGISDFPAALTEQRATRESPIVFMKRAGSEGTLIFR